MVIFILFAILIIVAVSIICVKYFSTYIEIDRKTSQELANDKDYQEHLKKLTPKQKEQISTDIDMWIYRRH